MSEQFIGEVRMFGGNFAPSGWAMCNGQLMSIVQNTALFSLVGTTYGGDGVQTFALPDLRGRLPNGQGQGPGLTNRVLGEVAGSENVALLAANTPLHTHQLQASSQDATGNTIGSTVLPGKIVTPPTGHFYVANTGSPGPTFGNLNPLTVGPAGNGLPHSNMMPSLCVTFIIALVGIFPSRN